MDQAISTKTKNQAPKLEFSLVDLIEALRKVDLNNPKAKLNQTSIADNNGSRIEI